MFDRIYLINLKRRPDRISAFEKLRAEKGWNLPEPIIFEAVDGSKVGVPDYYIAGGGAWGCCRSHVRIIEQCVMDDVGSVLVLEDDLTWMSDAWDRLAGFMKSLPSDWDQLMLGGQHLRKTESVSPGVHRCSNCHRTHAYAVRGRAMKDLLNLWYKCNTHVDHAMGPWQAKWRVYAPDPFIFGQGPGKSDISGNRDNARFWTPPSQSAPVVHLTAPREVARQLRDHGLHMGHMRDRNTDYDAGLTSLAAQQDPSRGLKKWLDTILWEAASEEGSVATVWHPAFTVEMVQRVYSGAVVPVSGMTLEECLPQLPTQSKRRPSLCRSHAILLRSSRGVMESLRGHGWHSGYWRDDITGQDNGLRAIAKLPQGDERRAKLAAWVDELASEAEAIPGGVACAWHPDITTEDLAGLRKVVVIEADSVGDAIQQFQEKQ